MKSLDFYIDLGTANTLIYASGRGFLLNEPSMMAMKDRSLGPTELFGLGTPAKRMLGKTPESIAVIRPLREGVIADFENTARMLHGFLQRVRENVFWFRPRMLISLPCQVTPFERRAVEEVGLSLGARRVDLLDEPMAAAIGAGLSVLDHRGQMIVDIGGGTTEIAVISLGGIVTATAVRVGGDDIDAAIIEHLKSHFRFAIGQQTAERLKCEVGSLEIDGDRSTVVGGINLTTGLPGILTVSSRSLIRPIEGVVKVILQNMRAALEQVPPEIAGDIAEGGILCAGGGALLRGLPKRIEMDLGVKVRIAGHPLLSVAMGGARALEEPQFFDRLQRPS